ncbi:MAG: hypothetical protein DI598_08890 [Pseudopedobacter saltans]|uniref:Uncharacterized protein n=1 Tax=Pseudopedobacter saltans TaxID=151895 RepID=A0A2W5F408_9SPHI|nr:MAG: hypothetical protein DI598_08890 [Pseudopedobacter saltans]
MQRSQHSTEMNKRKNKQANKYQLLTLVFLVIAIVYVWQCYQSFQIVTDNRNKKIIFNAIVAAVAIFVSWFYFREAQRSVEKEK